MADVPVGMPVATSAAKRAFDVVFALIGLIVSAPLVLLIVIAIRLDSRGPVLFRQGRAGLYGRTFQVLKFRTMHHGTSGDRHKEYVEGLVSGTAEHSNGGVYKLVQDDRITRVGRVLRSTSLDELPQIWNVLRGEMSLIGPRPAIDYEVDLYEPWQKARLAARPGITGLWQVSGRNLLTYRQMCELDAEYIRRWSFWLDLKIFVRTIPVVLFNSGGAQ